MLHTGSLAPVKAPEHQEFLTDLLSKRKDIDLNGYGRVSRLDITSDEREKLYEIGERCGLLTTYEFSGISCSGMSRNDAARRLLDKTRKRAFARLRDEFGAAAHFWPEPRQLPTVDFYWRLAKLGVVITGPLFDYSGPTAARARDVRTDRNYHCFPKNLKDLMILSFPYYFVWHHPSEFIAKIKQKLVASGRYPRLSQHA